MTKTLEQRNTPLLQVRFLSGADIYQHMKYKYKRQGTPHIIPLQQCH